MMAEDTVKMLDNVADAVLQGIISDLDEKR